MPGEDPPRAPAETTRRQFLSQGAALAAGVTLHSALRPAPARADGRSSVRSPTVVIARDEALTRGAVNEQGELLVSLLNASMQRLTGAADAGAAWRTLFAPNDRVGIKVNTLGRATQPAVVDAIVAGLRGAGLPAQNILVWDRFDVELAAAGYRLNKSRSGVRCYGTDSERAGAGYQRDIQTSGQIGSCFSRIVTEQVDALISVPVLKDHSLAGASLGLKNFYGAIHNPNKYHENNCDPFVADVANHRYIRSRWRLTVCDATRAQYHAGPTLNPGFAWPFGGLLVGSDVVAVDAVGADLLEAERRKRGLVSLTDDKRPAKHIATAAAKGLGVADLARIQRIEV